MRILFNHGLTTEELYTNTPKKIIDKKWSWFISNYGITKSYEDAIADPFKYCFGLIMNRIIDEKVRFIIPYAQEAYIDFEIVTGDKFEQQRQNGRFSQVDFIESDFTGYFLRYYYKGRAYQKSYPIYLGGALKQKFLDKINSGEKFYSIKNITINDFLISVHEKFPELTITEIKKLLNHGFRRLHSAMRYGCAISINTRKFITCTAYIGLLSLDPETQIKQYSIRRDRKLRKIEGWKKPPFDGYYYIGLNPTAFDKWVEINKKAKVITNFVNIIPRKIQKEIYYKAKHLHIFRFKRKDFKGWSFWAPKLKLRDLEYIGEVYEHKFSPSNKTWRELIKENEKGSNQYF